MPFGPNVCCLSSRSSAQPLEAPLLETRVSCWYCDNVPLHSSSQLSDPNARKGRLHLRIRGWCVWRVGWHFAPPGCWETLSCALRLSTHVTEPLSLTSPGKMTCHRFLHRNPWRVHKTTKWRATWGADLLLAMCSGRACFRGPEASPSA